MRPVGGQWEARGMEGHALQWLHYNFKIKTVSTIFADKYCLIILHENNYLCFQKVWLLIVAGQTVCEMLLSPFVKSRY